MKIEWFGHASFRISDGKVVYIDPYILPESPRKADLILITHEHYDHCANTDRLKGEGTVIVTTKGAASKVTGNVKAVGAGDIEKVDRVTIKAVSAYNIGKKFHPKGLGVGFVVGIKGKKIYHAGDTDFIPEMKKLEDITVAMLPIGGTYTMDVEEAVKAAKVIKPKIVVPMHYGAISGTEADPHELVNELEGTGIRVETLEEKALKL